LFPYLLGNPNQALKMRTSLLFPAVAAVTFPGEYFSARTPWKADWHAGIFIPHVGEHSISRAVKLDVCEILHSAPLL
jgi:hypothetical protein